MSGCSHSFFSPGMRTRISSFGLSCLDNLVLKAYYQRVSRCLRSMMSYLILLSSWFLSSGVSALFLMEEVKGETGANGMSLLLEFSSIFFSLLFSGELASLIFSSLSLASFALLVIFNINIGDQLIAPTIAIFSYFIV